ncbi:MAG: CBS domain-containing protein [Methylococcales bacterium]|nr:CBS domain-containing protein [Methylococcales bacterium]
MSTRIVTVEMDDSLGVVKEIFDNTRFHHILVIDSDKLVGVISDRDLLKVISPNIGTAAETTRDSETLNKCAHQIMTRKLITLKPTSSIIKAIQIFNTENISCIPIINNKHQAVGIVSWRDILRTISHTEFIVN